MDAATIEDYLRQAGLKYTKLAEDKWLVEPSGRARDIPIHLGLASRWVFVVVSISPSAEERSEVLYERLLRMNANMRMAKMGLTETGDLVLTVELPVGDLQLSEFQAGIAALLKYEGALLEQ